jgi:hypothetical protein
VALCQAQAPLPDVKLEVRTRNNQRTFRIGEIIPLDLRFSSTVENKYRLYTQNGDGSGRLNMETYTAEPRSGWQDPLDLFYRTGAFAGGGLGNIWMLSDKPFLITAELNEWMRFDRPGEYRLTVTSARVRDALSRSTVSNVASNEVLLTIIDATPEWQEETLRKALATLAVSAPVQPYDWNQPDPGRDAIRTVRFLGTPAAARELAFRFSKGAFRVNNMDIDCVLGLAGSPAHQAALDEMKKALQDDPPLAGDGWIQLLMMVLTGGNKQ